MAKKARIPDREEHLIVKPPCKMLLWFGSYVARADGMDPAFQCWEFGTSLGNRRVVYPDHRIR